jgi:hypothetical protein
MDEVSGMILTGLRQREEAYVVGATNALVRWGKLIKDRELTTRPDTLIEKLLFVIEMGVEQTLHHLVHGATLLVKDGLLSKMTCSG